MLPYLHPLSDDEKTDDKVIQELWNLLCSTFWDKGVAHTDIRWANIGWDYQNDDGSQKVLILFDLAMCINQSPDKKFTPVDAYDYEKTNRNNSYEIFDLFVKKGLKYSPPDTFVPSLDPYVSFVEDDDDEKKK
jgi:hypothetical protein